ncbi:MAG: 4Fe-4S dicluster domain-containing protein [Acidobacteria bacterium]|nr:4Fe-4S dicluster domain-containing protein [Acidobacteriota bacterium]
MDSARRNFVAASGKLLLLTPVAAAALDWVLAGEPEKAPGYALDDHWWAFTIDIARCIGCGSCVRACKTENHVPLEPYYFRTWVERYRVKGADEEHPQVDSPDGAYNGFPVLPAAPDEKSFFVPKLCNHCAHSPCVQVCPVGATFESPDGVVLVDKSYCLGCRYCVQACPYGCRYIHPETMTADKCTLCYHRITRGLTTACAENCPSGARRLADLKDPKDPIHAFLRENAIQVLKPQMATGSKCYYKDLDGAVR